MENAVSRRSILLRVALGLLIAGAGVAAVWLVVDGYTYASSRPGRGWDLRLLRLTGIVLVNFIFSLILGGIGLLFAWVRLSNALPELKGWHRDAPQSEFIASDAKPGYSLDDYLQQEEQVFKELDALMQGPWLCQSPGAYNRYDAESVCNPETIVDRNWNRSHVLESPHPKGGVLLLHGLSDSPYSLRVLGERLHAEGYTVVWLRLPGHGTCPAALAKVAWKDWTAAVRVAMAGLKKLIPHGTPMILGGYSNGGALSVHYAIESLDDLSLPPVHSIVLFSPMIGINPMARMTRLYHTVGLVSRNQNAQWSSIDAEIDPFKFSSWPMNASVQAWSITQVVERKLAALEKSGRMDEMPPILAMQSIVDSTVVVPKLLTVLFDRLKSESSELFLFDINRVNRLGNLLNLSFEKTVHPTLNRTDLPYQLLVLKNVASDLQQVAISARKGESWDERPLEIAWPDGVVSLSHIAVPISPDDPIYGTESATENSGLSLGSLSMRAEPSALLISNSLFVRCRNNPFYSLMEDHVIEWLARSVDMSNTEA